MGFHEFVILTGTHTVYLNLQLTTFLRDKKCNPIIFCPRDTGAFICRTWRHCSQKLLRSPAFKRTSNLCFFIQGVAQAH